MSISRILPGMFSPPYIPNTFRKDQEVISELNTKVNAGQVLALVGPSGGGKSTVVSLLERFYEPTQGTISIDGVPIHLIDPDWYHRKVSIDSLSVELC